MISAIMHDRNSHNLTEAEWKEIADLPVIRESWGLEESEDPLVFASYVYAAKFNFISGSPGYVGDVYIIQGDSLTEPMVLRRDKDGHLIVC